MEITRAISLSLNLATFAAGSSWTRFDPRPPFECVSPSHHLIEDVSRMLVESYSRTFWGNWRSPIGPEIAVGSSSIECARMAFHVQVAAVA